MIDNFARDAGRAYLALNIAEISRGYPSEAMRCSSMPDIFVNLGECGGGGERRGESMWVMKKI